MKVRYIIVYLAIALFVCVAVAARSPRPCTQWTIATRADTTWYEVQCTNHSKLVAEADTVIPHETR